MNNLKYYNDSLAYDFEMFAPKTNEEKKRDNIVVMPGNKTAAKNRRKAASKRVASPMAAIMFAVFVLAGFCGNIALRLQINEVDSNINDVKAQIAELNSQKTELEVQLQKRIAYANLELEAAKLGMCKPEKDDVVYIRVNDKNAANTADGFVESEE